MRLAPSRPELLLKFRVKNTKGGTALADPVWEPKVLSEMKKRDRTLRMFADTFRFEQAATRYRFLPANMCEYRFACEKTRSDATTSETAWRA